MDQCKNLCAMVDKHKKKKENYNAYGKSNIELNAPIKMRFKKLIKSKKRKTEKELQPSKTYKSQMTTTTIVLPARKKALKVEKSHPPVLYEK